MDWRRRCEVKEGQALKVGAERRMDAGVSTSAARQAETASSALWQAIADNIPQLAWVTDPDGAAFWYNKQWYDYTGLTFDQVQGWGWQSAHHPDHLQRVSERFAAALKNGQPWEDLFPLRRADGEFRTFLSRANPIRDPEGRITHWFGTNTDVTEDRRRQEELERSEERARLAAEELEAIYEAAPIGLTVLDRELRYVRINKWLAEINGVSAQEHIGRTVREVVPSLSEQSEAALRRVLEGEEFYGLELTGETASHPGVIRTWRENWVPLRKDDSSIDGVVISAEEITHIKEADRQRHEAEERYRAVFEQAAVGVARVAPEGSFLEVNDRYCQILGRTRAELLEGGWEELTHPDDLGEDARQVEAMLRGELHSFAMEKRYLAKDGSDIWVHLTVAAERDAEGQITYFISVAQDIGERKSAELALRRSEEQYRALFESMEQGFCIIQVSFDADDAPIDYRFTELNPAFSRHTGLNPDVLHRSVREAVPGLERVWFDRYGEIARTGQSQRFVEQAVPMERWFEVYAFRIGDPSERNVAILFTDVTAEIKQERALAESEARLRAVIDAAPIGLVFADPTGRITGGNTRVEEIIGGPVVSSRTVADYQKDYVAFHRNGRRVEGHEYPLARVLTGKEERPQLVCQIQRGDGSRTWVRYVAAPVRDPDGVLTGGVVASIDIDREVLLTEGLEREVAKVIEEREAAQEALRQSQKLEAMGQLTGGVAHDFNNLLTPIIGSLDLIQRKQIGDARTQRLIDGALQSAEKAKVLVQRLLAFARRQPLQPTAIDVGRIVDEMADLISSTSGPRVKVEVAVETDLPHALADANQVEMALLNLSVNARDAMPDGGTLTIAARSEVAPGENPLGLQSKPYVVLSVADTGMGMDDETKRRAIEPFFSTKGVGKGTGLGLSMVHGLAAQLGGALRINSRPGLGTSIELWLPIAIQPEPEVARPASNRRSGRGAGVALLVDDEELVRVATATMLTELGYEVVEADSAEEALAHLRAGVQPSVLVTDHLMPGMTGTDLALQLRDELPDLPVLIVSGYADVESLTGAFPHLTKPFRQSELAEQLKAAGSPVG